MMLNHMNHMNNMYNQQLKHDYNMNKQDQKFNEEMNNIFSQQNYYN